LEIANVRNEQETVQRRIEDQLQEVSAAQVKDRQAINQTLTYLHAVDDAHIGQSLPNIDRDAAHVKDGQNDKTERDQHVNGQVENMFSFRSGADRWPPSQSDLLKRRRLGVRGNISSR
jgi:hypothetical protein